MYSQAPYHPDSRSVGCFSRIWLLGRTAFTWPSYLSVTLSSTRLWRPLSMALLSWSLWLLTLSSHFVLTVTPDSIYAMVSRSICGHVINNMYEKVLQFSGISKNQFLRFFEPNHPHQFFLLKVLDSYCQPLFLIAKSNVNNQLHF